MPTSIQDKKKKVLTYMCPKYDRLDTSGYNSKKFRELIEGMSEAQFKQFATMIREGKWRVRLEKPNMASESNMKDYLAVADELGVKLFQRLRMTDPSTGRTFLTPEEYPIYRLPIRRTQQSLGKKRSMPGNGKMIDTLSGQLSGDDKTAAVSMPEIMILSSRQLPNTMRELTQVRGGDINALSEFKNDMEDKGVSSLAELDPNSRTRTSVMLATLLRCAHIDNNIIEGQGEEE